MTATPLRAVDAPEEALCERYARDRRIRELIEEHDRAEATIRRVKAQIRPLARQWADEVVNGHARQFTMPSMQQLRKEVGR